MVSARIPRLLASVMDHRGLLATLTALCCIASLAPAQGFLRSSIRFPVPPNGVHYQPNEQGFAQSENSISAPANALLYGTMDMNGDGYPDLVVCSQVTGGWEQVWDQGTDPHWKVYLGDGQQFGDNPISWNLPEGGYRAETMGKNLGFFHLWSRSASWIYATTGIGSQNWVTRDITGDGLPDLVVFGERQDLHPGHYFLFGSGNQAYWKVYPNTGTGFSETAVEWPVPYWPAPFSSPGGPVMEERIDVIYGDPDYELLYSWQMRDLDGDDRMDLIVASQSGVGFGLPQNPHWRMYRNNGAGFDTSYVEWPLPAGGVVYADSTHGGFTQATNANPQGVEGSQAWDLQDLNGDGLLDLVVTSRRDSGSYGLPQSPHWRVYLNHGTGFDTVNTAWALPQGGFLATGAAQPLGFTFTNSTAADTIGCQTWSLVDMDADSLLDLVVTSELMPNGLSVFATDVDPYWKTYRNLETGFDTVPYRWQIPYGGMIQSGNQLGYNAVEANLYPLPMYSANSRNWFLQDMNGDSRPDLVATGIRTTATSYFTVWELYNNNTHWKVYLNKADPVGGSEEQPAPMARAFPNPAHGELNLEGGAAASEVQFRDVQGRLIHQEHLAPLERLSIDVGAWARGLYMVQARNATNVHVWKIVLL